MVTRMGNAAPNGIFTPAVIVTRNIMGEKEFNKFRGKIISLHSQGRDPEDSLEPWRAPG